MSAIVPSAARLTVVVHLSVITRRSSRFAPETGASDVPRGGTRNAARGLRTTSRPEGRKGGPHDPRQHYGTPPVVIGRLPHGVPSASARCTAGGACLSGPTTKGATHAAGAQAAATRRHDRRRALLRR